MDDLTLAVIIGLLTILLLTVMIARALLGDRSEHLNHYRGQVTILRAHNQALRQQVDDLETHLELYRAINAGLQEHLASLTPALPGHDDRSNVAKVLDYYHD